MTCTLLLLLAAATAHSIEIAEIVSQAQQVNQPYEQTQRDWDTAQLTSKQSSIAARTETEELQARQSLLGARARLQGATRSFLLEVANAAVSVETARLDARIAEASGSLALADLESTESRVRAGLAPNRDLLDARLESRSASSDAERARFALENALDTLEPDLAVQTAELAVMVAADALAK